MLRLIYLWNYRRAQNAKAFRVPTDRGGDSNGLINLGSYLAQSSVRGRTFDRFDLPRKRRKGLALLFAALIALLIGWVVIESIVALALLKN